MNMKFFKTLLLMLSALPFMAFAVSQGSLGTTSTGTVGITLSGAELVQISGLSDIVMLDAAVGTNKTTDACVFTNGGTGTATMGDFDITATTTSGGFNLVDTQSIATPIPYTLNYYDAVSGGGSETSLPYNAATSVHTTNVTEPECSIIGNDASFKVTTLVAPVADTLYKSTLTLTLTALP